LLRSTKLWLKIIWMMNLKKKISQKKKNRELLIKKISQKKINRELLKSLI
jgi:hypothetical protein